MAIDPPWRLDPLQNIVNVQWKTFSWAVTAQSLGSLSFTNPAILLPGAPTVAISANQLSDKSTRSEQSFGPEFVDVIVPGDQLASGASEEVTLSDFRRLPGSTIITVNCAPSEIPDKFSAPAFVTNGFWSETIFLSCTGSNAINLGVFGQWGPGGQIGEFPTRSFSATFTLTPVGRTRDQGIAGWDVSYTSG